jgi:hypothetical protein
MQPLGRIPALVDSGADFTTFSDQWAELRGIDLERDCEREEVGVMDERPSWRYSYADGLNIEVAGELMFLPLVKFCKKAPFAALGRKDFFDRYLVLIDDREHRFFLERLPNPDERKRDDPDDDVGLGRELVLD